MKPTKKLEKYSVAKVGLYQMKCRLGMLKIFKITEMNKKIIGYILFVLSFAMWFVPAFISFFSLAAKQIAIIVTTSIIAGEVFFVLSLIILGKAFWLKIKRWFYFSWLKFSRKIRGKIF
jgi:hypothetical protein